MSRMMAPPTNFVETNKVGSVLNKVRRKLEAFVNGDKHATGEEYDAVFSNVQIGKTPRQRSMLPTDVGQFLRYMVFGADGRTGSGLPWGFIANNFKCSTRVLDQAACEIARLIALEKGQMMYADRALEILNAEVSE